jgi:hypothetical protein
MSRVKIFGREPVVILTGLQSLLAVAVAIPALGVTPEVAAWVVTLASLVLGGVEAAMTRPFTVPVMTTLVRTVLAALVMFNVAIPAGLDGAMVALGTFVLGLTMSNSVTPKADPDPTFTRAQKAA